MLILGTFNLVLPIYAQSETIFLPQQAQDLYYELKKNITKAHKSIKIYTSYYHYKPLNYHIIKAASKGIEIKLYTNRRNKQIAFLDLYKNITLLPFEGNQTKIFIDDVLFLQSKRPLDRELYRTKDVKVLLTH